MKIPLHEIDEMAALKKSPPCYYPLIYNFYLREFERYEIMSGDIVSLISAYYYNNVIHLHEDI